MHPHIPAPFSRRHATRTIRTTRGPWVILLPVSLITLAACTAGGTGTPAGPSTGVVSSGPLTPPNEPPTSPNPVTPQPIKDGRKQPFTKAVAVPGGKTVRVEGLLLGGPPCNVIGHADVSETTSQVTITLWAGSQPDAQCDRPQPTIEFPFVLDVELDQPLGNRSVIDGAR